MSIRTLRIELELDDKDFSVRMIKAGDTVKQFKRDLEDVAGSVKRMERSVTGILPKLRDFFVTLSFASSGLHRVYQATAGWQLALINTNAEIERTLFLLKGMSSAADDLVATQEAASNLDYLLDQAERAPFALNELTNTFVKFKSVGLDPIDGSMRSLTDAVAAFGGNEQILHRATVAIQQMAGKGVISMEELRQQLGEAVPNAIVLMARSLNLTYQELVDKISKGQVESSQALARTFAEFERSMGGAGQRMMQTWSGMMSVMQTRWIKFQLAIGNSGYFDDAKEALASLLDYFDETTLKNLGERWGQMLGDVLNSMIETAKWIARNRHEILGLAKAIGLLIGAYKATKIIMTVAGWMRAQAAAATASAMATGQLANKGKMAAGAMIGLSAAARGASAAMALVGGPIGAIIMALTAAVGAWRMFSNEAKRAADAVRETGAAMNEMELQQTKERISDLDAELARARKRLDSYRSRYRAEERFGTDIRHEMELIRRLESERTDLAQIAYESEISLREQRANRAVAIMERELGDQAVALRGSYREQATILDEQLKLKEITQEQHRERMIQITTELYGGMKAIYQQELQELELYMEQQKAAGKDIDAVMLARLNALKDKIREYDETLANQVSMTAEAMQFLKGTTNGMDDDPLKTFERNLRGKIANVRGDIAGLMGDFEKFKVELADGKYGLENIEKANDSAFMGYMQKLFEELDRYQKELKRKQQIEREATKARESLNTAHEKAVVDLESVRRSIDSAGASAESSFINTLNKQIAGYLASLEQAGYDTTEFAAKIEELRYAATATDSLRFVEGLTKQADAINNDLLSNERDRLEASYMLEVQAAQERARLMLMEGEDAKRVQEGLNAWMVARHRQFVRDMEHPLEGLARNWESLAENMRNASVSWAEDSMNALVEFVTTGKASFSDLAESIIKDIIRIQMQQAAAGIMGNVFSMIGGSMSAGGMIAGQTGYGGGVSGVLTGAEFAAFANGGIMTPWGKAALRRYASGGVANSPQIAVFGEGSRPEAYVPLPDGKNIPVRMEGGMGNVQVNVINQTGQNVDAQQGQPRFDGEKMVLDVVLNAVNRPGPFRDGMKGALK